MTKIIRTATVPASLNTFCRGLLSELKDDGYDVVAVSSPGKEFAELGEREGVRTIAVPMERHISPLKDFVSLCKMTKVMMQEKPDMVHSMTPKAGLVTMIAAWIARVPVRIHTFTGLVWPTATGLSRKILMTTDWITCACATHVIPEGEGVKADLAAHITKKPMKVLGYGNVRGIDLAHYVRKNENYNENENLHADGVLTFLFVGRLVKDKGINELVRAFVRLWEDFNSNFNFNFNFNFNSNSNSNGSGKSGGVRLILVGPEEPELDPLLPETKRMIAECSGIEAVGAQKDVRPWMEMSDVLAFPSYREGFPNVVIEAGAMDLPCIVTDINGSREIIVNENSNCHSDVGRDNYILHSEKMKLCDNGVIIPSQNEEALYEAMKWMIEHPEERERMAKNARPMVARRFEQSYVRQCLKEFYKEVLNS